MMTPDPTQLTLDILRRAVARGIAVDSAENDLKKARREWNELRMQRTAALRAEFEKGLPAGDLDPSLAEGRLLSLMEAWQELEEVEAGRKMALHECLSSVRDAKKGLRQAMTNARQLELFGGSGVAEDESDENDAPAGRVPSLDELKRQAKELGLKGYTKMNKTDLIGAIVDAGGTTERTAAA